jgi:GT2 family glycosyltransferase
MSVGGFDISVVLGTRNRLDSLKRAVASITGQTSRSYRVYVIDAGSTDGTVEYLRTLSPEQFEVIIEGERRGQARSYNDIFQKLSSPYVCWLSDDNEVINGGLDEAALILDQNPSIGMVALKVRDVQGPFVNASYIGGVSSVGVLNANQGMLRREVLQGLGGFNEEFRDYGIDPDLTIRVLLSGHNIAHTRKIALKHYRDWGPGPESAQFKEQMERQRKYQELYSRKYGYLASGGMGWKIKKAIWGLIRRLKSHEFVDSTRSLFGALPRDWQNAMCGRYISIFDSIRYRHQRYHLVQHAPRRQASGKIKA